MGFLENLAIKDSAEKARLRRQADSARWRQAGGCGRFAACPRQALAVPATPLPPPLPSGCLFQAPALAAQVHPHTRGPMQTAAHAGRRAGVWRRAPSSTHHAAAGAARGGGGQASTHGAAGTRAASTILAPHTHGPPARRRLATRCPRRSAAGWWSPSSPSSSPQPTGAGVRRSRRRRRCGGSFLLLFCKGRSGAASLETLRPLPRPRRGIRRGLLENIFSFGPSLPDKMVEEQVGVVGMCEEGGGLVVCLCEHACGRLGWRGALPIWRSQNWG